MNCYGNTSMEQLGQIQFHMLIDFSLSCSYELPDHHELVTEVSLANSHIFMPQIVFASKCLILISDYTLNLTARETRT